jgi:toxin ParE1/3/4
VKKYRLTERAVDDLRSIGRYTVERWGIDQRNKYLRQLNGRFAWLANNPRLGRSRTDISKDYYSFSEGEHLIFYRINGDAIEIIGIPHRQMDIPAFFGIQ